MKRTRALSLALFLAISVAAGTAIEAGSCSTKASPDLVRTAMDAGSFDTLVAAVQAAGLVEALQGDGPFTIFAPTDEAFAALPDGTLESLLKLENKAMLASILTYHVAPGRLDASRVASSRRIETLNGQRPAVTANDHGVKIDEANVIRTDIETSNGIIHVIDRVILPSSDSILETAVKAGKFETLAAALDAAGLVAALEGAGPFTVFAPTDEAFAKLPSGTVATLLEPANEERLAAILKYHVVAGNVYSTDAADGARFETLEGSSVRLTLDGDRLKIDGANVVSTDIPAVNGVIHVIDRVIMPADGQASISPGAGLIRAAIARGVPLFNHGQASACAAVYQTAAQGLVELDAGLHDTERARLLRAMHEVEQEHDAGERAWIMRHALDDVYASMLARADVDLMPTLGR